MNHFKSINWPELEYSILYLPKRLGMKPRTETSYLFCRMLYTGLVYRYFFKFKREEIPFDVEAVVTELEGLGVRPERLLGAADMTASGRKKIRLDSEASFESVPEIKKMLQATPDQFPALKMSHLNWWVRHYNAGAVYFSVPDESLVRQTKGRAAMLFGTLEFTDEQLQERLEENYSRLLDCEHILC